MSTPRNPHEAQNGSFKQQVRDWSRAVVGHAQIRVRLAVLEAREACQLLGSQAVYLVGGAALLFVGYLLSVAALVSLMAEKFGARWELVALGIAALHLLGGGVLVAIAKTVGNKPLFEATLQELEKDEQWLDRKSPSTKTNGS